MRVFIYFIFLQVASLFIGCIIIECQIQLMAAMCYEIYYQSI